ncbi:MAG: DUF1800 domain-containing protein [Mycobacteriales bacterium]
MPADPGDIRHLLRRAAFLAAPDAVRDGVARGYDATVSAILHPVTGDAGVARTPAPSIPTLKRPRAGKHGQHGAAGAPSASPSAGQGGSTEQKKAALKEFHRQLHAQLPPLVAWWVDRMAAADHAYQEKLTFVWHGHWATSAQKVKYASLMLRQNDTMRSLGSGSFADLAHAMIRDPAMLVWLDGVDNKKQAPNENLGREFMEVFTLGHGNYSETDVRQAARALTGWTVDRRTGKAELRTADHDDTGKTILGHTDTYDDASLVDLVVRQPASARFVATSLWQRFAAPGPPPAATLQRMVSAYGTKYDIAAMMRTLFLDPAFRAPSARNALVKQPTEWLVSALRAFGLDTSTIKPQQNGGRHKPTGSGATPSAGQPGTGRAVAGPAVAGQPVVGALSRLGQVPFFPPSVGGWPGGPAWLSTAAVPARLQLAQRIAAALPDAARHPLTAGTTTARLEALAETFGIDGWSNRTRAVLTDAAARPAELVAVGLTSPEFVVC